jgi:hypothetical protein
VTLEVDGKGFRIGQSALTLRGKVRISMTRRSSPRR